MAVNAFDRKDRLVKINEGQLELMLKLSGL